MTAGAAMPAVIEETFQSLLNDNFDDAYSKINNVRKPVWFKTFSQISFFTSTYSSSV